MALETGDIAGSGASSLQAHLLGPFSVTMGEKVAGPWARPPAKRLCALVLMSANRRIARETAYEILFPQRGPAGAAQALTQALSTARAALSDLGSPGRDLLRADRTLIWADPAVSIEVDLDVQQAALLVAERAEPGLARDDLLLKALAQKGTLLEDEPFAEWALRPREHLEQSRQHARLALARDRARGFGRSSRTAVVEAWQSCFFYDPACEEAATALIRLYGVEGERDLVKTTHERCQAALEELGLQASPALIAAYQDTGSVSSVRPRPAPVAHGSFREERRLISVLFAELGYPRGGRQGLSPEELRDLVGGALAEVVDHVEGLGGTVTSVSGAGLVAVFGAPQAHEDDPERALRTAFLAMGSVDRRSGGLSVRAGVETGSAMVGPLGGSSNPYYGAVGEVVAAAAAIQSVARPASVLVGPSTMAAAGRLFEWGPTEEVITTPGATPLLCRYLGLPRARAVGREGRRRLAARSPLVGRETELGLLRDAVREATTGTGRVVVLTGEPGLGKTRLVRECRNLFMAWAGAGSGRLPLWLEGRAASYESSTPYGIYRQLLFGWLGVGPEEGDKAVHDALTGVLTALFKGNVDPELLDPLCRVMGLAQGQPRAGGATLSPEQLQRATFAALAEFFARLISFGPVVLALEDLHWADPTSVQLTGELCSLAGKGPLLVILTRRPNPDGVAWQLGTASVDPPSTERKIDLVPLTAGPERALAQALLGKGASSEVVEVVIDGVEGNPFFLEERLATLVETGALARLDNGGWFVDHKVPIGPPEAIERLVRSRVDRLSATARDLIAAASVLGAQFEAAVVTAVVGARDGVDEALSELCSAGLTTEVRRVPQPVFRFRHSLIQEATYRGLSRNERRGLHGRAAWALEEASGENPDQIAGVLGHHYAEADDTGRAAHYLELAGDQAAALFANDEAVASYSWAVDLLSAVPGHSELQFARLWLKLGGMFLRTTRYDDARHALTTSANLSIGVSPVMAARAYITLADLEVSDHRHDQSFAAFAAAEELLEASPDVTSDDWVGNWLEVQLGRAGLHYWRNEPDLAAAMLRRAQPLVEARAAPRQRALFYTNSANQRARASRFRIDESYVAHQTAAWAAVVEGGLESELWWVQFSLGFALLWYGDLVGAQIALEWAVARARRMSDKLGELRCLTYLGCTALRQRNVALVKEIGPQCEDLARAVGYPEYEGVASAFKCWTAWEEGRPGEVEALAGEALGHWGRCVVHYAFQWLCLWPLIAARLADGRLEEAVAAGRQLLMPPQQRLPDEVEALVQAAIDAWDQAEHRLAEQNLSEAFELARQFHFA